MGLLTRILKQTLQEGPHLREGPLLQDGPHLPVALRSMPSQQSLDQRIIGSETSRRAYKTESATSLETRIEWPLLIQRISESVSDSFRAFWSEIERSRPSADRKTVGIRGIAKGSGTTSTILALGCWIARQCPELEGLLVDANLRSPGMAALMKISEPGDWIDQGGSRRLQLPHVDHRVRFAFLSRPHSPSEAVALSFQELLEHSRNIILDLGSGEIEYDKVSPFVSLLDAVVSVIDRRNQSRDSLRQEASFWTQTGIEHLGFIETFVNPKQSQK